MTDSASPQRAGDTLSNFPDPLSIVSPRFSDKSKKQNNPYSAPN